MFKRSMVRPGDEGFGKDHSLIHEVVVTGRKVGAGRGFRAHEIMGKNFFGVEDWITFYGANFSQKQLRKIAEFPWGEDVLASTCPLCGKMVKDCHFAFLGLDRLNGKPLNILKFQELHPATVQPRFASYAPGSWYSKEEFAVETTMNPRWYLLHQNIISGSEDKNFSNQSAMLTVNYEVPSAIVEATKDLLVFQKTGNFVNPSRGANCKCVKDWDGKHVIVGTFTEKGLNIDYWSDLWDGYGYDLGIAASRVLNKH